MTLLAKLWEELGGPPSALDSLEVTDRDAWLGGRLPVDELAVAAIAGALLAAAELAQARSGGGSTAPVRLSAEHAALSFQSERHALLDGRPPGVGFAPLSRFVRCADGRWARTHGNYPHHAAALERALGVGLASAEDPAAALASAALKVDALGLEERVVAQGGCAAALRDPQEWAGSAAGRAVAQTPLIARDRELARRDLRPLPPGSRPAQGIRVLDLTRVIAGPVAGRTLAALGADVLRIDPPSLPELPAQHLDTGPGKRTAVLDLHEAARREQLLAGADVLLCGYRPGALDRLGLGQAELASRHPHLIQVSLSAWGTSGPWAARRGFDSLVQVACGIAAICGDGDRPGALPAQALDHATGHLMAAAALRGLAARVRGETSSPARLSLAATARELLAAPRPPAAAGERTGRADPARHRVGFDGGLELIAPPGELDGAPLRWDHGQRPLGADEPVWAPR